MKALLIALSDCTGQNAMLKRAAEKNLGWKVRSLVKAKTYLGYETDLWARNEEDMQVAAEFAQDCDLFIFQDFLMDFEELGLNLKNLCHQKNTVITGQGSIMRANMSALLSMQLNGWHILPPMGDPTIAPYLAAAPFEHWMIDVDRINELTRGIERNDKITICHAPTRPRRKGTATWERIVKEFDVEWLPVMGVSWEEAIRRKAVADIVVDSLGDIQYTAGNCFEGLAMGQEVVSNISQWCYCLHRGLPIIPTNGTKDEAIRNAITRAKARIESRKMGRQTRLNLANKLWVNKHFGPMAVTDGWRRYVNWMMEEQ